MLRYIISSYSPIRWENWKIYLYCKNKYFYICKKSLYSWHFMTLISNYTFSWRFHDILPNLWQIMSIMTILIEWTEPRPGCSPRAVLGPRVCCFNKRTEWDLGFLMKDQRSIAHERAGRQLWLYLYVDIFLHVKFRDKWDFFHKNLRKRILGKRRKFGYTNIAVVWTSFDGLLFIQLFFDLSFSSNVNFQCLIIMYLFLDV